MIIWISELSSMPRFVSLSFASKNNLQNVNTIKGKRDKHYLLREVCFSFPKCVTISRQRGVLQFTQTSLTQKIIHQYLHGNNFSTVKEISSSSPWALAPLASSPSKPQQPMFNSQQHRNSCTESGKKLSQPSPLSPTPGISRCLGNRPSTDLRHF